MMPSRASTKKTESRRFLVVRQCSQCASAVAVLHGAYCIADSTATGVYPTIRSGILVANPMFRRS
jgi:hypothetical protein